MTPIEHSLTPLILCLFILFIVGVAVFTWGKKLPAKGSWLIWGGILSVFTGIGLDTGLFLKQEFKTKIWMAGWIWPRDEMSAITIGVIQDPLSYAMIALSAFLVMVLLLNQNYLFREPRPERSLAAIAISLVGVALSWSSLTPWLSLGGLALTLIGGFISFGSRWDSNAEAKIAARFISERSFGFILAFFGACILATTRFALLFTTDLTAPLSSLNSTASSAVASTWVGSILLVLGLFIQMQPFLFLGGLVSNSEIYPPIKTLLNQIFPAWAAFALLMRATPHFVNIGLFPVFGWVALCSSLLSLFSGLFQNHWRQVLGLWLSSGLSLSCAVLGFCGPMPAMAIFIGVSISAFCLSITALSLENNEGTKGSNRNRGIWVKIALFFATASGTGVIGFITATGGLRWISQAFEMAGGVVAAFLFVFFFFVLLGWKLAWSINKISLECSAPWLTVFSLFLCLLLSFGFFWTGSLSGDVLLGVSDKWIASGFEVFFGAKANEILHAEDFLSSSGLYWSALITAFITAYWMSGRREDHWTLLARMFPKTSRFLSHGYGVDQLCQYILNGISKFGRLTENLVDHKIWNVWVPKGLFVGVKSVSGAMSLVDKKLTLSIGSGLRRLVDVPAKILQLIQVGDVRWYLFFALSSGFALLTHYLKM